MPDMLAIRSNDDLISYVPHLLGFTPEASMVCVAFGDGPSARVDLPESPEAMGSFLDQLCGVYLHRHHPNRVALLAYGEDGGACLEALAALGDRLLNRGAGPDSGPELGPVLWVNGDQWLDVLHGTRCTVNSSTRARMDAEFALMGRVMPTGRREDLAAAMRGDSTVVAEHLPAARARILALDVSGHSAEIDWLESRIEQFLRERTYPSDVDAARVLALIDDRGARDAAVLSLSRENASVFTELWQDLVRRAPAVVRDTPATLLALSSFLEGKGAQAWVALDQIAQSDQLAELVAVALEQAVDPREWDRALPAVSGAWMQQSALRDAVAPGPGIPTHAARRDRGIGGVDPDAPAPGR